jgi:hypothetical protein
VVLISPPDPELGEELWLVVRSLMGLPSVPEAAVEVRP